MEELLKNLNIMLEGIENEDGDYEIKIPDSNEYSKIYSLLDKSELVEEDPDSHIEYEKALITFDNDEYSLIINANFEDDLYKLIVKKISKEEK